MLLCLSVHCLVAKKKKKRQDFIVILSNEDKKSNKKITVLDICYSDVHVSSLVL